MHPYTTNPATIAPTNSPSASPSLSPSNHPSKAPTASPFTSHPLTSHPATESPSFSPSRHPITPTPTFSPTKSPIPNDVAGLDVVFSGPQSVGMCTATQLSAVISSDGAVGITWWTNGIELIGYNTAQISIPYEDLEDIVGAIADNTQVSFSVQVYQVSKANNKTYFSQTDHHSVTYVKIVQPAVSIVPIPGIISPSNELTIEGNIQYPPCHINSSLINLLEENSAFTYTWEIEKEVDGSLINLNNAYNSLSLAISPNILPPNQVLIVRLVISGLETQYGIAEIVGTTTIETGISDVVAKLNCGENNELSRTSVRVLDASDSYDPSSIEDPTIIYKWRCIGICEMNLPEDGSTSSITIPENSLTAGVEFTVALTYLVSSSATVQDREDTVQCTFQTVSTAVPKVVIKANSVVPAGSSIKMQTDTSPHPESPASSSNAFTYSWSETSVGLDMSDIHSATVVLSPAVLIPGTAYRFRVLVTDTLAQTATSASISVLLRSEAAINVDVQPSDGFEYLTRFTIACVASVPAGGTPIEYQLIDSVNDETNLLQDWGGICQKTTLLKEGQHTVSVQVRDAYGSVTVADAINNVNVTLSPPTACGGLTQANELLIQLLSEYGIAVDPGSPGKRIIEQVRLLSQIAAHGDAIQAAAEILGNLLTSNELEGLDSDCIADSSYANANEYERGLWDNFLDVLQTAIDQQGNIYTDSAIQSLLILIRSPFSPANAPGSILDMVNSLRDTSSSNSLTSGYGRQLSTCIDILAKNGESEVLISNSLNNFLNRAARSLIPGEAVDYEAETFSASASLVSEDSVVSSVENGVNVVLNIADSTELSLGIIKWNDGYPKKGPQVIPDQFSLQSSIVDVTLTDANGTDAQIHSEDGGYIDIIINITEATNNDLECQYYNHNIEKWATDGCILYHRSDLYVTCRCTHLTEFAVMARHKDGEVLPTHVMKIAYIASASTAGLLFLVAIIRVFALSFTRKHKTWVGFVHICISLQTLTRMLSSFLFSGISQEFSLNADPVLVYVIAALPYSFWFLTSSLITFQWMSMTFSRVLKKDPFRENKKWYFLSCGVCTAIVWTSMALLWFENVKEMEIFGSAFIAFCCILLLTLYIASGYRMHQDMTKAFKLMEMSSKNAKMTRKSVSAANKIRDIAVSVAFGFPILSIIWVVSVSFTSPTVLDVVVPAYLVTDAIIVIAILSIYKKSVRSLSSSRSSNSASTSRQTFRSKRLLSFAPSSRVHSSVKHSPGGRRSVMNARKSLLHQSNKIGALSPTHSMIEQRSKDAGMSRSRNFERQGSEKRLVLNSKTRVIKLKLNEKIPTFPEHLSPKFAPNNLNTSFGAYRRESTTPIRAEQKSGLWSPSRSRAFPSLSRNIGRKSFLALSKDEGINSSDEKALTPRFVRDPALEKKSDLILPPGWAEHFTDEGQAFYYNAETKESSWDIPRKDSLITT
eukprot:CAMPEP_0167757958 /NCGR_PEP_ID=MMETSP0110_2-20121227/10208_1 /TAXON_ID=629695 /ORGANISM="Gymnochlora sp., Strain CCMP2014" /LENGTH=1445 /DNA_ID=CAMNT_0007644193 /DNA_START=1214 /DNA_END=5551 /DNA_ORIENTATION=-